MKEERAKRIQSVIADEESSFTSTFIDQDFTEETGGKGSVSLLAFVRLLFASHAPYRGYTDFTEFFKTHVAGDTEFTSTPLMPQLDYVDEEEEEEWM